MEAETTLAGRFVLGHVAGSGGMGVVHRALDLVSGWDVAVKLLHPTDDSGRARFEREAAALAGLAHEAIVGYVAHGATPDGRLYLVTEWIDGPSLEARLARGPLAITEALTLGRRLAGALAASHARGIVHRDVKPSNVLLPSGDIAQAMLIDFGIARAGELSKATQTGVVLGTPGYMAPEQARGEAHVDGRADLFSLGCVLFEALSGAPPFDGEHVMAILAKILLQPAAPLATVRPGIPAALADLVARMLAKDVAERPASAEAVLGVLSSVVVDPAADAPVPPRSAPLPESLAAEVRLVSVVVVTDRSKSAPPPRPDAEPASDRPTVEVDTDLSELVGAFGGTLEVLADGSHLLVFSGTRAATDQAVLAARCALRLREHVGPRPVVALATGRGRRSTRWPVGEGIDRAVELSRRAPAGAPGVWIDEVTAGLLDARWEVVAEHGARRLVREAREGAEVRQLLGKPTPFVGRARELRMLEGAVLSTFESAEATCVLVKGAAGTGKTRLRVELVRALGRDGAPEFDVWTARADAMRRASPLGIAAQIVRAAARVADDEGLPLAQRRLWATVDRCVPAPEAPRVAVFLAELAGVPFDLGAGPADDAGVREGAAAGSRDGAAIGSLEGAIVGSREGADIGSRTPGAAAPGAGENERAHLLNSRPPAAVLSRLREAGEPLAAARRDPRLLGDQMQRAFEDFLAARCAERPALIVVEDLHWADGPSLRFLDAALRQADGAPLCVLGLGRPEIDEVFPGLWADRRLVELRLRELGRKPAEELLRAVLGPGVPAATVESIVARAAGNALCLEELIRAAAAGDAGAVPGTVLAIAQARLGALAPELRRVLRAASVLGSAFWRGAVAALLGGEARVPDLPRMLRDLVEAEVIERDAASRFAGDEQYAFRNGVLRDAAYAMLADEDRAGAHALAADWLAARGETDARVVASHLSLAGRPDRAPRWLLRAAEQAIEAGDLASAVQLCERGLEGLHQAAADSEAATLQAAAADVLGAVGVGGAGVAAGAGGTAGVLGVAAGAGAAAGAAGVMGAAGAASVVSTAGAGAAAGVGGVAGVAGAAADVLGVAAGAAGAGGAVKGAVAGSAAVRATPRRTLVGEARATAGALWLLLAEAQRWRGAFAACEEAARAAMDVLPRGGRAWLRAVEEALVSAGRRGDHAAVRALAGDAGTERPEPDALAAQMVCLCAAARHFLHAGDLAEADAWMGRAAALAEEIGPREPRAVAEMFRLQGARARQIGDPVADREAYGRALAELERAGDARAACNARTSYGFSCIQVGAYGAAERELLRARSEAERLGLDGVRVRALQNLGLVRLACGDAAGALALEEEVVAACRAQGNARFEAWTRVYLAMIAERAGDAARAEREAALAAAVLGSAPSALAGVLAIWARALTHRGDREGARAKAAEALALLDRLGGIEEFEPLVRAAYAQVFGMQDERARRVVRDGLRTLERHASRLADPAERAAYLDGVAEHRALRALSEAAPVQSEA